MEMRLKQQTKMQCVGASKGLTSYYKNRRWAGRRDFHHSVPQLQCGLRTERPGLHQNWLSTLVGHCSMYGRRGEKSRPGLLDRPRQLHGANMGHAPQSGTFLREALAWKGRLVFCHSRRSRSSWPTQKPEGQGRMRRARRGLLSMNNCAVTPLT